MRSGRLALPTPDWRTGTLLLRHERRQKTRPMPDSGRRLASIISDWAKRFSDLGITIGASLRKMAAPAGFAPALPGLKFRCPRLLDDEAVWSETSVRLPTHRVARDAPEHSQKFAPGRRRRLTRQCAPGGKNRKLASRVSFAKKNTHRRPSRYRVSGTGLDGRRICTRTLG